MKKALSLLAVAVVGLGTVNAWATDSRILPGMMCLQIDGSGIPNVGWQGALFNLNPNSSLRVSCPIVRDNDGAPPSSISVSVVQPTAGGVACCQFYSTDSGTDNISWGNATACTPTFSGAVQTLNPSTANGSFPNGTEFLFCTLSPLSSAGTPALISYRVQE